MKETAAILLAAAAIAISGTALGVSISNAIAISSTADKLESHLQNILEPLRPKVRPYNRPGSTGSIGAEESAGE